MNLSKHCSIEQLPYVQVLLRTPGYSENRKWHYRISSVLNKHTRKRINCRARKKLNVRMYCSIQA